MTTIQKHNLVELIKKDRERIMDVAKMDIPEEAFELLVASANSLFWVGELLEDEIQEEINQK